ncbi:MAG: acyl carrier protein [Thermoanaerobaculia bacterium]
MQEQIKELLVERLKLEREPASIGDDEPLFGPEGLGLDSIDALELVLGIEQVFGVTLDDQQVGSQVLATVNSIAEFVAAKRDTPVAS